MESQNPSEDNIECAPESSAPTLSEDFLSAEQNSCKRERKPKRILQFSDGEMVEYSSEDEADAPKTQPQISAVDPKSLNWGPWAWYQTTWVGTKLLNGCDYVGEALADFLGITSPKYQFEIDEYHRMHAAEAERAHRQDVEMGGWSENHQNNVITNDKATNPVE
ncbi:protein FAM177A1 [Venturia canescens]|uniref:protein FAM177A1 n=1 Tax=Venturia canescens TaxID=32260 RepID=UPI001C9CFD38|nr:protein FAM177A1 [Venturia canescens]